jgi:alkylated DNA nucleotide flippase Atl1
VTPQTLFDLPPLPPPQAMCFNGPAYDPDKDRERLAGQILRIYDLIADGRWRTLGEIAAATGDPQASISAQLRHLRKPRFGGHRIDKQRRGSESAGLWEYRLEVRHG